MTTKPDFRPGQRWIDRHGTQYVIDALVLPVDPRRCVTRVELTEHPMLIVHDWSILTARKRLVRIAEPPRPRRPKITPEQCEETLRKYGGCDNSCVVAKPMGMATNGGCRCDHARIDEDEIAFRTRVRRSFAGLRALCSSWKGLATALQAERDEAGALLLRFAIDPQDDDLRNQARAMLKRWEESP